MINFFESNVKRKVRKFYSDKHTNFISDSEELGFYFSAFDVLIESIFNVTWICEVE